MRLAYGMKTIKLISGILLIFCIGFLVAAIYLGYRHYNIINTWEEVSATVIYVNHDDETFDVKCIGDNPYDIIGNFHISHFYSSSINEGDIMVAFVNPDDYSDIYFMQEIILPIVFGGVSFLFLVISLIIYLVNFIKYLNNKKCKENGKRLKVSVTRAIDTSSNFNGRRIYRLVVMYQNKEYVSQAYYFKENFIEVSNHKIIDLYLLDNKYYIDLDSLRSGDLFDDKYIL